MSESMTVVPVVRFPRTARVGQNYLVLVDLQLEGNWPFEEEEQVVHCLVDAYPQFTVRPLDQGVLLVHRFGGTYGPTRFLLVAQQAGPAVVTVTLIDRWEIPFHTFRLESEVVEKMVMEPAPIEIRLAKSPEPSAVVNSSHPQRPIPSRTPRSHTPRHEEFPTRNLLGQQVVDETSRPTTSIGEWIRLAPKPRPLGTGEKWNVFLSYRSISRAWVLNLYDVLRELGYSVFVDQYVLTPGDELLISLQDALSASQAVVLVWSDATRESDWVRREYNTMERMATSKPGFQFIPVKLDDSPLPQFAENRIFLDFSAYPDGPNGGDLLRLLHAIVGEPLTDEAVRFAAEQDEAFKTAATKVNAAIRNGYPERLQKLFADGELPWLTSATLGCKAADGLMRLGCREEAIAMLQQLEERFPKAIRPKQLRALALARRGGEGDLETAQEILGELYELDERDPETVGIYARTWMDRHEKSGQANHLKRSRDLYAEAFDAAEDDYYMGINAAAKSVLMGGEADLAKAAEYAARVAKIVGTEPRAGDYWMTATVGEVFLIQKQYADAARLYDAAVSMAPEERGSHGSTWKQACRLMEKLRPTPEERALVRKPFEHLPDCGES